jgi:hypothetical protein
MFSLPKKRILQLMAWSVPVMLISCSESRDAVFQRSVIIENAGKVEPKAKAIADIDNDGYNDIMFNTRDGFFWFKYPDWQPFRIGEHITGEDAQAADLDGDGDMDVITSPVYPRGVIWWENPGSGQLADGSGWSKHVVHDSVRAHDVLVEDINQDGRPDIVCEDGILLQNDADRWTLLARDRFAGMSKKEGSDTGDIDGDGDIDFLRYSSSAPYRIIWYENPLPDGMIDSAWPKHEVGPGFEVTSLRTGDIDQDGRADILAAPMYDHGSGLVWFKGPEQPRESDEDWQVQVIDSTIAWVPQSNIFITDINLDGNQDLLILEMEQSDTKRIAVYYNDDGKGMKWRKVLIARTGGHNAKMGDIDNDGDPDLLNANHGWTGIRNPVEIWRNKINP